MKKKKLAIFVTCLLLACLPSRASAALEFVSVGDVGNAADSNGYGAVNYAYSIGKYEVTNAQYAEFLNAVAKSDPHGLYDSNMNASQLGGIQRTGAAGNYSYTVKAGFENRPVNFVTFLDAARYVNWLTNGGGSGSTEYGSYDLSNSVALNIRMVAVDGMAYQYFVASEDEWYKAAYYDPSKGGGLGGYWKYATRSDTEPTAAHPSANPNTANFGGAVGALTDVGSYIGSASYYGTFDQEGNVGEILETMSGSSWARRGSSYSNTATGSGFRATIAKTEVYNSIGFRIVMVPTSIPEPATTAFAGMGMVGLLGWRFLTKKTEKGRL